MFIQLQVVITFSMPWSRKMISGIMLIKNAMHTAVLTCFRAQSWSSGFGLRVIMRGQTRIVRVRRRVEVIIIFTIAATWSCTKSFWFLRPMDELLSFRSKLNEPRSLTVGVGISSPYCIWPLSVDKGVLTPIFRITI